MAEAHPGRYPTEAQVRAILAQVMRARPELAAFFGPRPSR
jgi:hypothetical protein